MAVTRFESVVSAQSVGTADIEKLAGAFDKLSGTIEMAGKKSSDLNSHPGFDAFAQKIKAGISDPLGAIGSAAEGALRSLGPMGVGLAGLAGALGAVGAAGFSAAKGLGEYADQIGDTSVRLGLSAQETAQFSFAMKRAGGDISTIEGSMRKLSQALADNSEDGKSARKGLQDLGIDARDIATGRLKPMSEILLQLSERLGSIPDAANRNAAAIKVMGRSALEALPDLLDLTENLQRARELGLGPSDKDLAQWGEYQKRLADVEAQWEETSRRLKAGVAVPIMFLLGDGKNTVNALDPTLQASSIWTLAETAWQEFRDSQFRTGKAVQGPAYQESIADRRAVLLNDKQVAAGLLGTDEQQLTAAERKLQELRESLKTGVLPEVNTPTFAAIDAQKGLVAQLEARIKRTKDLVDVERELASFELQQNDKGLGPVASIFARRDDLVGRGANAGRATDAALIGAGSALQKEEAVSAKQLFDISLKAGAEASKNWEDVYTQLQKVSGLAAKDFLDWAANGQQFTRAIENIQIGEARSRASALSNRAIGFAELAAGPGGEVAALNAGFQERIKLAEELYSIEANIASLHNDDERRLHAESELRLAVLNAEIEHEQRLAELQRRRIDSLRNEAGQLFDALLQGPNGVKQFVQSFALDQARKVFQNVIVEGFGGLSPNLGLPGKIFGGTILGKDPLKDAASLKLSAAGDGLSIAAGELMAAARSLALSPSGGGGGGGVGFGGLGEYGNDVYGLPGGEPGDFGGEYTGGGGGSGLRKGIGLGAAAAAGGFGIYSGIRSGGARGGLTAAASGAALAGVILPLVSKALKVAGPIGEVAAIGLGLITSFLPDPKHVRDQQETDRLNAARYTGPLASNYSVDRYGRGYDTNFAGDLRPIQVTVPIYAIDTKSVVDHSDSIGHAVAVALEGRGSPRLNAAVRNVAFRR